MSEKQNFSPAPSRPSAFNGKNLATQENGDHNHVDDSLRRVNSVNDASSDLASSCRRCRVFKEMGPNLVNFLTEIPKTDLHVHLDGSPRLSTLIELAQEHHVDLPAYTEEGLRALVFRETYDSLVDYLRGFPLIVRVLQQPGALERIAYEFAWDCLNEGVLYIEPRFAPQLLATATLDVIGVLTEATRGLERAKKEYNAQQSVRDGQKPSFDFGIICCAMRTFMTDVSEYYHAFCSLHQDEPQALVYQLAASALFHAAIKAKKDHGLPVVGVDIAGQEAGYPAAEFQAAFEVAHKNFLGVTVHAGEAFGPEAVFQAITDLHCERLGHGYHLFSVDKVVKKERPAEFVAGLVQYVAKRRIMLEVCLSSNRQTMTELRDDISKHALKDMLAHGICVSLCTDNRLVSNTTVVNELLLAIEHFALTPTELKTMIVEGFKRSFFPGSYLQKRKYVGQVMHYYEHLERKYGLEDWYFSEDSMFEDQRRPQQPQTEAGRETGTPAREQGREQENENIDSTVGACLWHSSGDRIRSLSPQWTRARARGVKMPEGGEATDDGKMNRGLREGRRRLEMPPEVFM